jgi:Outer membrane protein beta-barrel domain
MVRTVRSVVFAAGLLLSLATGAMAQDSQVPPADSAPAKSDPQAIAAPASAPVTFSIDVRGELNFNADLKDGPGNVTTTRVGATFGAEIPAGDRAKLDLGFDYEFSRYDFSDATGLVPGVPDPWQSIQREELRVRFNQQQTLQFGWFVGGAAGASGEDGAKFSDSLFGALYGGARYSFSKDFTIGLGVAVWTAIEDNPVVVPIPVLYWRMSEQWKLSTDGKLGLTLSYSPTDKLTFSLSGEYQYRDFRLDQHGPIPDGAGRETRVPIILGVKYEATPRISLEAGFGYAVLDKLQVLDSGGNKLGDDDLKAQPLLNVRFGYKF